MLRVSLSTSISNAWERKVLGTLPAEYEPLTEVSTPVAIQGNNAGGVVMKLTHECNIIIEGKDTSWRSGWVFGVITYVTV